MNSHSIWRVENFIYVVHGQEDIDSLFEINN